MTRSRSRVASCAAALAATTALCGLAEAQVPDGHAVVATHFNGSWFGARGLFIFPLDGGPSTLGTRITGLPGELGASSGTPGQEGAWAVSLRSSDGAIIVTSLSDPLAFGSQGNVTLFVLHLSGTVVTQYQAILLGTGAANVAMNHAQLPDGRILVHGGEGSTSPVTSGPMMGHWSAIVDPASPSPITVLPNPTIPAGQLNSGGVAVDPSGRFFYMLMNASYHGTTTGWTLLRQDLTPPFADCAIADDPNESAHGIRCDDDGTVYVTSSDPSTGADSVHTIVPDGCNPAAVTTVTGPTSSYSLWALDLDRASGSFISANVYPAPQGGELLRVDAATGASSVIGRAPSGGWSLIGNQGVAVNNVMRSYGPRSDGANRYWFENFPNPGGQPVAGNTGFSLTTGSAPGNANLSAMSIALGRGSANLLGVEVLVDQATVVTSIIGGSTYALPIPPDSGLAGVELTAQSLHLESGNTVAASRGLEFSIYLPEPPSISSVSPVAPLPGATVTLTGTSFLPTTELRVNGNLTPIASLTLTTITFTMPTGVMCDSMVSVSNVGGSASSAFNGTPGINSMVPGGPAAGGALFWVSGSNLAEATVTIGGAPLASIQTQSAAAIVGFTPPGTVGVATVVIATPTGCQTTGTYTYQ